MSYFFSKASLLAIGAFGLCVMSSSGQTGKPTDQILKQYTFTSDYWISLPEGYDPNDTTTLWPTIFFLHGASESNFNGKIHPDIARRIGPGSEVDNGRKLPFIIVTPHAGRFGWKPKILLMILEEAMKDYHIDPDRLYLTGMSMGGFGTWDFAKEYPHYFAAIAPVCGGSDTTDVHMLANVPIWAFHGAKDEDVDIKPHTQMVETVSKYNNDVHYTIFPEGNHHIYFEVYRENYLYDWFLTKTRFKHPNVGPLDRSILEKYVGMYKNDNPFSWWMPMTISENGTLYVWGNRELIPIAENRFAFDAEYPLYLEFTYNEVLGRMELDYHIVPKDHKFTHFWKVDEE